MVATNQSVQDPVETDAVRSDISAVAGYLQSHIGQRATAYLSGLKDVKTVGQWAAGKVQPRDTASLRLRHGYRVARMISEAFGDEAAKAWLFGTNRLLGDVAPASVLRAGKRPPDVAPVIQAARSFAEGGRRAPDLRSPRKTADLDSRLRALERSNERIVRRLEELLDQLEGGRVHAAGKAAR